MRLFRRSPTLTFSQLKTHYEQKPHQRLFHRPETPLMSVDVQELPCREGRIGLLTLNSPGTLNALTEMMIVVIRDSLESWAADERICVAVSYTHLTLPTI